MSKNLKKKIKLKKNPLLKFLNFLKIIYVVDPLPPKNLGKTHGVPHPLDVQPVCTCDSIRFEIEI